MIASLQGSDRVSTIKFSSVMQCTRYSREQTGLRQEGWIEWPQQSCETYVRGASTSTKHLTSGSHSNVRTSLSEFVVGAHNRAAKSAWNISAAKRRQTSVISPSNNWTWSNNHILKTRLLANGSPINLNYLVWMQTGTLQYIMMQTGFTNRSRCEQSRQCSQLQ